MARLQIFDKTITPRQAAEHFAATAFESPRKVGCYLIEPPRFQLVDGWKWYRVNMLPNYAGWEIVGEADDVDCEAFTLRNDPPKHTPARFQSQDKTRQRVLVEGMDCLPGQQDLF